MFKHVALAALHTSTLGHLGRNTGYAAIAGMMGLSATNPAGCQSGMNANPQMWDRYEQPVAGVPSAEKDLLNASQKAETADLYFWAYDCTMTDAREATDPVIIENHPLNEDLQSVTVWFPTSGSKCLSAEAITDSGEVYKTKDILEDVDGNLAYPNEAHIPVELSYGEAVNVGDIPMWEQIDWDEIESVPEFNHEVIVILDDYAVENLELLADPHYEMFITGCVSTSAGGMIDLLVTPNLQGNMITGTATDAKTYLIPGEECTLELEVYETGTGSADMLRAHGASDFIAPPSSYDCSAPSDCTVIPTVIEDLKLYWDDSQIQAILVKEGELINFSITLNEDMMRYLHEFDADDLTYDIYLDGPGNDDHQEDLALESYIDNGATRYRLVGTVSPVDDVTYLTTVSIYLDGGVLMWAVAELNLAGTPPTSLEFVYAITLVSEAASQVPHYAYATTDSAVPVSAGVLVEATCGSEKVTCLTGAATLPSGELSSHSGAYVCQLDLPYGTECTLRYSYPGFTSEIVGPMAIDSMGSVTLPTVWLEK